MLLLSLVTMGRLENLTSFRDILDDFAVLVGPGQMKSSHASRSFFQVLVQIPCPLDCDKDPPGSAPTFQRKCYDIKVGGLVSIAFPRTGWEGKNQVLAY